MSCSQGSHISSSSLLQKGYPIQATLNWSSRTLQTRHRWFRIWGPFGSPQAQKRPTGPAAANCRMHPTSSRVKLGSPSTRRIRGEMGKRLLRDHGLEHGHFLDVRIPVYPDFLPRISHSRPRARLGCRQRIPSLELRTSDANRCPSRSQSSRRDGPLLPVGQFSKTSSTPPLNHLEYLA